MARKLLGLCLLIAGCTGTDYIADPPMLAEPQPTLTISPDMAAIEVGQSQALQAIYLDEMGMSVDGVTIEWAVSNPTVATVDQSGTVSGLREGQVSITARVGDTVSEPVTIGIAADPTQVALVRIAESGNVDLSPGDTSQLTTQTVNGRGETLERMPTWQSSDPAVATVDSLGQITAIAAGQATVTAVVEGKTSNAVQVTVLGPGRMGMFVPNPNSHYEIQGSVSLERTDAGSMQLVFGDNFQTNRGPRLHIYLSTTSTVSPGSIDLGELKSTTGTQTYAVPAGIELSDFSWVIIHCVPFNVSFGWAQLQ